MSTEPTPPGRATCPACEGWTFEGAAYGQRLVCHVCRHEWTHGPTPPNRPSIDLEELPEDRLRRYARRLGAIEELHAARVRDVDGYTLRWCRECGQNWPCPTIEAARADG